MLGRNLTKETNDIMSLISNEAAMIQFFLILQKSKFFFVFFCLASFSYLSRIFHLLLAKPMRITNQVLIALMLLCCFVFKSKAQTNIIHEIPGNQITLQYQLTSWQLINAGTGKQKIDAKGLSATLQKGMPETWFNNESVVLDAEGDWKLVLVDSIYTDIPNVNLISSKGNIKRPIDPATVPYYYGPVYQQNNFWPAQTASLGKPYIMRSTRGAAIQFNPFRYNPVTKVLRVYNSITVQLEKINNNGINPLPPYLAQMPYSSEWKEIIHQQFINGKTSTKYSPLNDEGSMLIVCHNDPAFISAMQPFVEWKTQRGMKVELIDYTVAGGTPAGLKGYIQTNFPVEAWTFILLVGDEPQISPMYLTSGPSDNDYAYLAGNDSYPELLIGRFSAETSAQVITMVEKSIWYERDITNAASWLSNAICIASDEGPGDDNQMDWEHSRALGTILNAATYTGINELFDGNHGGLDDAGNPNPADVTTILEGNGAGLINYTGHGSNASIVTSGFSNGDVINLDNVLKLPLFISVGCVNGEFQTGTCFAEHWLRARKNNQLTGAAAVLMSTINQSWNPPMEGQDEMVNLIANSYANNVKRTFGGIAMNGCMQMNDTYGAAGDEMTDTWVLFGDPSLLIRTATPQNMVVSHPGVVILGATTVNVNCSFNGARITLTQNGTILASEIVAAGMAQLNFTALSSMDSITVTAVGYNQVTYLGTILVTAPNAAFLTSSNLQINDAVSGNNNQQADYQETIDLNISLNNIGTLDATAVSATISTNDTCIASILVANHLFGNITAGNSVQANAAFKVLTEAFIPDGHIAQFDMLITDASGNTWNSNFSIPLHAPVLLTSNWIINDASGNQNGRLDAGETATITLTCENIGSSPSVSANLELTDNNSLIVISNPIQSVGVLANTPYVASFVVQVSPSTPAGTWVDFDWSLNAGAYQNHSSKLERIGMVVEDFETGDFSAFNWTTGGNAPWITTNFNPFEGATCSKSGNITDSQTSTMQIQVNVAQDDSIYFMHKESCEDGWDFLRFYVDGVKKGEWSGSTAWTQAKYPLSSGMRTLKWTYAKDVYAAEFSDCVWVDDIVFPMLVPDTVANGVKEIANQGNNWMISPNPSNGTLVVSNGSNGLEPAIIQVFSANGALLKNLEYMGTTKANAGAVYHLNDLPEGFYLIRITQNYKNSNFKWVKTEK
jgi:hypothetical protein